MSARSLVALLRPFNLIALWGATEAGSRLAGGPTFSPASLAPVLAAAFGYARNDAIDAKVDRTNKPNRPIPSGRVSAGLAGGIAWLCLVLGFALTLALTRDRVHLALFLVAGLLLYFYSPWLKNLGALGPSTVALLAGLAVVWGASLGPHPERSLVGALIASFVTFARECAKDLEDVAGDQLGEKRSWPLRAGEGPPRLALRVASGIAIVLIPIPWLSGAAGLGYFIPSIAVAAPILLWCVARPPRDAASARRTSRALKLVFVVGIVGLWLGATRR